MNFCFRLQSRPAITFIVDAGKYNTGRGSHGPHTKRGKRDELS